MMPVAQTAATPKIADFRWHLFRAVAVGCADESSHGHAARWPWQNAAIAPADGPPVSGIGRLSCTGSTIAEVTASKRGCGTAVPAEAYHFIHKFRQVYSNHTYAGAYEIITRVQGDVTNSYFIGYTDYAGRPDFYERFRDRALK